MKIIPAIAGLFLALVVTGTLQAQKIKVIEGSVDAFKSDNSVNFEFTYDSMKVGKYDKEEDYVAQKQGDYNLKEPHKGDTWAKNWVDDRHYRFEPKFEELFLKYSEKTKNKDAKYTLIFKTTFTEPGYYFSGLPGAHKVAEIRGEVWIVESTNKNNVIAKLSVTDAIGRTASGFADFDTGSRIAEAYADAGKALGKYLGK